MIHFPKKLLFFTLLLLNQVTYAIPNGWYLPIAGGVGNRSKLYIQAEKTLLENNERFNQFCKDQLTDKGLVLSAANLKKLQASLYSADSKAAISIAGLLQPAGLGYQFSPHLTLEGSYMLLWSAIMDGEDVKALENPRIALLRGEDSKSAFLHGLCIIGKVKIPLYRGIVGYVQLGGGLLSGTLEKIEAFSEKEDEADPIIKEKLGIKPTLLAGVGFQYQLSCRTVLDVSYLYTRVKEISGFHCVKLGVNYHF